MGHDCHEVGHAGDEFAWNEIYDECIAFGQGDAGHTGQEEAGADTPEAGTDSPDTSSDSPDASGAGN